MLTYELEKRPGLPLYEALYRAIRADILAGRLKPGDKLPSKRALAENLRVGKTTVEGAFAQLTQEGYIRSRERVGYFVEAVPVARTAMPYEPPQAATGSATENVVDLTSNGTGHFPFNVWSRLQRRVILDYGESLLLPLPPQGALPLRRALAAHLAAFRGMNVSAENIVVGAGTDYLYNLLVQLLGRERVYAVEEPGYAKIRQVYSAAGAACVGAPMDAEGVKPDVPGGASVLHISPAHHFPSGTVTPLSRRRQLLDWARGGDRWIVEDDYDSEFRSRNLPALQSLEPACVIYMNTFSKSLAPSFRIGYMVLPDRLLALLREQLGFYGCTVPSFEQYTLAAFLSEGYFEKHINRMRRFYRQRRDRLTALARGCSGVRVLERDSGLHFLLALDTELNDGELVEALRAEGVRAQTLSGFYHDATAQDRAQLVVNYSGVDEEAFSRALAAIQKLLR